MDAILDLGRTVSAASKNFVKNTGTREYTEEYFFEGVDPNQLEQINQATEKLVAMINDSPVSELSPPASPLTESTLALTPADKFYQSIDKLLQEIHKLQGKGVKLKYQELLNETIGLLFLLFESTDKDRGECIALKPVKMRERKELDSPKIRVYEVGSKFKILGKANVIVPD